MYYYINKAYLNFLNYMHHKDERFYYLSLIKENDSYSIHGLWPQNTLHDYPTYCKNLDFDLDKLNPIMNSLKTKWYSKKTSNEDFWKHEYLKHGSCVFSSMSELEYFSKTLELYDYVINNNIIDNYDKKLNQILIPFDLEFKYKK